MPQIRLLALDLDGTLLDPERKLTQVHIDAVRRARDAGIVIALASGRNVASIEAFAKELEIEGPMVCSNGAHVLSSPTHEIAHTSLSQNTASQLMAYALGNNLHLSIYARHDVFFPHRNRWSDIYTERVRHVVPKMMEQQSTAGIEVTKMLFADDANVIEGHVGSIQTLLKGQEVSIVRSEADYLEILPGGINKGLGLSQVVEYFGLKPEEIAAIGDYYNDLEMLQYAGFSAAMQTAPLEVQAAANLVVPSSVEGGVACFIDAFLLNERK
ncbi:MAG: HAD family phosphatase [Fimbriimonadaceae bacterium]|nr:HAD family phosphatase [Fimbriimonadaceae bacterium]